jgi:hypothetical protein
MKTLSIAESEESEIGKLEKAIEGNSTNDKDYKDLAIKYKAYANNIKEKESKIKILTKVLELFNKAKKLRADQRDANYGYENDYIPIVKKEISNLKNDNQSLNLDGKIQSNKSDAIHINLEKNKSMKIDEAKINLDDYKGLVDRYKEQLASGSGYEDHWLEKISNTKLKHSDALEILENAIGIQKIIKWYNEAEDHNRQKVNQILDPNKLGNNFTDEDQSTLYSKNVGISFIEEDQLKKTILNLHWQDHKKILKILGINNNVDVLDQYHGDPKLLVSIYSSLFQSLEPETANEIITLIDDKVKIYKKNGDADIRAIRYYKNKFLRQYIRNIKIKTDVFLLPVLNFIESKKLSLEEAKEILTDFFDQPTLSKTQEEKLKVFFAQVLKDKLEEISWLNITDTDEQVEKSLGSGKIPTISYPDKEKTDYTKYLIKTDKSGETTALEFSLNINKTSFNRLKKELDNVSNNDFNALFDALKSVHNTLYDQELGQKILYLLFLVVDEEYRYVVEGKYRDHTSEDVKYRMENTCTGYQTHTRNNGEEILCSVIQLGDIDGAHKKYYEIIKEINDLAQCDYLNQQYSTYSMLIARFPNLSEYQYLKDAKINQNTKDNLAKTHNEVQYTSKRFSHFKLSDYITKKHLLPFTAGNTSYGYYSSSYSGLINVKKEGFDLVEYHLNSFGNQIDEIHISSLSNHHKSNFMYTVHIDGKNIKYRVFLEISGSEDDEKVLEGIIQKHKDIFKGKCLNDKYKSFAIAIDKLEQVQNENISKIEDGYKKLLQFSYEQMLKKGSQDLVLDIELDKSALVPIFREIIASEKNFRAKSISISLTSGSDIEKEVQELKTLVANKTIDFKGRYFPIDELVITCDRFLEEGLANINDFSTKFISILGGLRFRKVTINSQHAVYDKLGMSESKFHEHIDNIISGQAEETATEFSYPYFYNPDQATKEKEHEKIRKIHKNNTNKAIENKVIEEVRLVHKDEIITQDIDNTQKKGHQTLIKAGKAPQNLDQDINIDIDLNQDQDQDEDLDINNTFLEEKLITRFNIKEKVNAHDQNRLEAPDELKEMSEDDLQKIWDEITGGNKLYNNQDYNKPLDYKFRIDNMTQGAALMLFTYKIQGKFSGGLNLRFLPQGFYMVRKNDDSTILDFDIRKKSLNNPLKLEFNPIQEYSKYIDPDIFTQNKLSKEEESEIVNQIENLSMKEWLSRHALITDQTTLIKDFEGIFGDQGKSNSYVVPFLKICYYSDHNAAKNFLQQISQIKKNNACQFEYFIKYVIDPVKNNAKSGFNYFVEDNSRNLLLQLQADAKRPFTKAEFDLFFHLLDKTYLGTYKGKRNIDPILLIESFAYLIEQLKDKHKIIFCNDLKLDIKENEGLGVLGYRMIKILDYLDQKEVCKSVINKGDLKQQIFNDMLKGEISLAERGGYHALYGDKLTDFDKNLAANLSQMNLNKEDRKVTYQVKKSELQNLCIGIVNNNLIGEEDLKKLQYSLLRYIVTPLDDPQQQERRTLTYQHGLQFNQDLNTVSKDQDKAKLTWLFVTFPAKTYTQDDISNLYKNIQDNVDDFIKIVKPLSHYQASFQDIINLAKIYKKEGGKHNLQDGLDQIITIKPDWHYFSRTLENLALQKEGAGGFSFYEIVDKMKGSLLFCNNSVEKKKSCQAEFVIMSCLGKVDNISWDQIAVNKLSTYQEIKLKQDGNLLTIADLSKISDGENTDSKSYQLIPLEILDEDYFSLAYIEKQFLVLNKYYCKEYHMTGRYKFDKNCRSEDKPDDRVTIRIDFLRYFIKDYIFIPQEERRLKEIEEKIIFFFSSNKKNNEITENYRQIFEIFTKLDQKFENDTAIILDALNKKYSEEEKKNSNSKLFFQDYLTKKGFTKLLENFLDLCENNFSLEFFKKYLSIYEGLNNKNFSAISNIVDNSNITEDTKIKFFDFISNPNNTIDYSSLDEINKILTGIYDQKDLFRKYKKYPAFNKNQTVKDWVAPKEYFIDSSAKFIKFKIDEVERLYPISDLLGNERQQKAIIDQLINIGNIKKLEIKSGLLLEKIYAKILCNEKDFINLFLVQLKKLIEKQLDTKISSFPPDMQVETLDMIATIVEYDNEKIIPCLGVVFDYLPTSEAEILVNPSSCFSNKAIVRKFIHEAASSSNIQELTQHTEEIIKTSEKIYPLLNHLKHNEPQILFKYLILQQQNVPLKTLYSAFLPDSLIDKLFIKIEEADPILTLLKRVKEKEKQEVNKDLYPTPERESLFKKRKDLLGDEVKKKLGEISNDIQNFINKFDRDPNLDRDQKLSLQFDDSKKQLASHIHVLIGDKYKAKKMEEWLAVVDSKKYKYAELSQQDLKNIIKSYAQNLKYCERKYKFHANLDVLALLREVYFRANHKYPYSTQLLPLLYFVTKGDYKLSVADAKIMAEINTGQGKNLITALYVAFQAINGKASHVTSATDALSKRDYYENQRFYDYLRLKSHYIDHTGIDGDNSGKINPYEAGRIYHSSSSNFYFYLSKQRLDNKAPLGIDKTSWLSDETDTMLDNKTLWRLAVGGGQGNPLKELYSIANNFYDTNKEIIDGISEEKQEDINGIINSFITVIERDYNDLYYQFFNTKCLGRKEVLEDKIKLLLASAKYAASLENEKDYIIERVTIIGISYNVARIMKASGEPDRSSIWGDGVQQLLHARLEKSAGLGKFTCDIENQALTSGTAKQLIQYCGNFVGITGTMGEKEDLNLLSQQFGINSAIKIQPHQINRRKDMEACFITDKDIKKDEPFNKKQIKKLENILKGKDKVISINQNGLNHNRINKQPILIICENLHDAQILYDKLENQQESGDLNQARIIIDQDEEEKIIQIITGEEVDTEMDKKINLAGKGNMITVSTPMSGRGTDIKPNHEEGLYTILMSVFNNRETAQVEGRSGRNGAKGKTISLINANNAKYQKIFDDNKDEVKDCGPDQKLSFLKKELFKHEKEDIKKQVVESELIEEIFSDFCDYRNKITTNNEKFKQGDSEKKEDEIDSLLFDLDNIFAAFLDDDVACNLKKYSIDKNGSFEKNVFYDKVSKPVEDSWKKCIENFILTQLKVKCTTEDLEIVSNEIKQTIKNEVEQSNNKRWKERYQYKGRRDKGVNDNRKFFNQDDYLFSITGLYHHRQTAEAGDNVNRKFNEITIFIPRLEEKAYSSTKKYYHDVLNQNGEYDDMQQHMINISALYENGYEIKQPEQDDQYFGGKYFLQSSSLNNQIQIAFKIVSDQEAKLIENILTGFDIKESKSSIDGLNNAISKNSASLIRSLDYMSLDNDLMLMILTFKDFDEKDNFIKKYSEIKDRIKIEYYPTTIKVLTQKQPYVIAEKQDGNKVFLFSPQKSVGYAMKVVGSIKEKSDEVRIIIPLAGGAVSDATLKEMKNSNYSNYSKTKWYDFRGEIKKHQNPCLATHEKVTANQAHNLFIRKTLQENGLNQFQVPKEVNSDFRDQLLIADNLAIRRTIEYHLTKANGELFYENFVNNSISIKTGEYKPNYDQLHAFAKIVQGIFKKFDGLEFSHDIGNDFFIKGNSNLAKSIANTFCENITIDKDRVTFTLKGTKMKSDFLLFLQKASEYLVVFKQNKLTDGASDTTLKDFSLTQIIMGTAFRKHRLKSQKENYSHRDNYDNAKDYDRLKGEFNEIIELDNVKGQQVSDNYSDENYNAEVNYELMDSLNHLIELDDGRNQLFTDIFDDNRDDESLDGDPNEIIELNDLGDKLFVDISNNRDDESLQGKLNNFIEIDKGIHATKSSALELQDSGVTAEIDNINLIISNKEIIRNEIQEYLNKKVPSESYEQYRENIIDNFDNYKITVPDSIDDLKRIERVAINLRQKYKGVINDLSRRAEAIEEINQIIPNFIIQQADFLSQKCNLEDNALSKSLFENCFLEKEFATEIDIESNKLEQLSQFINNKKDCLNYYYANNQTALFLKEANIVKLEKDFKNKNDNIDFKDSQITVNLRETELEKMPSDLCVEYENQYIIMTSGYNYVKQLIESQYFINRCGLENVNLAAELIYKENECNLITCQDYKTDSTLKTKQLFSKLGISFCCDDNDGKLIFIVDIAQKAALENEHDKNNCTDGKIVLKALLKKDVDTDS